MYNQLISLICLPVNHLMKSHASASFRIAGEKVGGKVCWRILKLLEACVSILSWRSSNTLCLCMAQTTPR